MKINTELQAGDLASQIANLFELSGAKITAVEEGSQQFSGSPVFTVDGQYVSQGWTEWTEGFRYGSAILQFDATGEEQFLQLGREKRSGRWQPMCHISVYMITVLTMSAPTGHCEDLCWNSESRRIPGNAISMSWA